MKKNMKADFFNFLKRGIAMVLALTALVLTGCGGDPVGNPIDTDTGVVTEAPTEGIPEKETEKETEKVLITEPITYPLNSKTEGIKVLGERHLKSTTQINCDWTGSGIEMDVDHHGGDIVFTASATANCFFRAYVDGEAWETSDYAKPEYFLVTDKDSEIVLKDVPSGVRRIKLIKVTGYTLARAKVTKVSFCGTISKNAPEKNELYIEFVGDSICCAWGTIGGFSGAYTDQDGTLAYPLLIADRLGADYSVTALSGQGLLCGNPGMTNGYLYPSALRTTSEKYQFERKADIVVINIGTNDYSLRSQHNIDEAKFKTAYLNFLKTVAEKNGPNCQIYCLYNTMNDTFQKALLEACAEFGGEAKNVFTYKMTKAASGHPTIEENLRYTEDLLKLMGLA